MSKTITLRLPDHGFNDPNQWDFLTPENKRLKHAHRILDALAFAAANNTCPVDAIVGELEEYEGALDEPYDDQDEE